MKEAQTITIRNAPPGLRRRVKVAAAQEGVTAQAWLIAVIEAYLEERKREEVARG